MSDLRYTNDHEWARLVGDLVTVGITDYAQDQLGELVYVELPAVGNEVAGEIVEELQPLARPLIRAMRPPLSNL